MHNLLPQAVKTRELLQLEISLSAVFLVYDHVANIGPQNLMPLQDNPCYYT